MPMNMNAKERRKLLRQQQREVAAQTASASNETEAEAEAETASTASKPTKALESVATASTPTPVASEPVVVLEAPAPAPAPVEKENGALNAKQRRLLRRQQEQGEDSKDAGDSEAATKTSTATNEQAKAKAKAQVEAEAEAGSGAAATAPLNAKQRRLLKRKTERGAEPSTTTPASQDAAKTPKKRKRAAKVEASDDSSDVKRKRIHLTLFVGQLPFTATEAMVRTHFGECGDIVVRMLSDKKTHKFKGTAFIEVKDSKALGAALARHHSLLQGRRINVELTANGGGNNSTLRRGRIDSLREKQRGMQLEKAKALVQKQIESTESQLSADDVDDRVVDFLSWFDFETAKKALDEYTASITSRVLNRKAFFMGILKRFRQTDGEEDRPKPQRRPMGNSRGRPAPHYKPNFRRAR